MGARKPILLAFRRTQFADRFRRSCCWVELRLEVVEGQHTSRASTRHRRRRRAKCSARSNNVDNSARAKFTPEASPEHAACRRGAPRRFICECYQVVEIEFDRLLPACLAHSRSNLFSPLLAWPAQLPARASTTGVEIAPAEFDRARAALVPVTCRRIGHTCGQSYRETRTCIIGA